MKYERDLNGPFVAFLLYRSFLVEENIIGNGKWGEDGEGFENEYFIYNEFTRSYGLDKVLDMD